MVPAEQSEAFQAAAREYSTTRYHQPSDEYSEDWDFASMEQIAQFGFVLGVDAANVSGMPGWKAGDEFGAARGGR